ncbi:hypothetical protein BDK51DRAFT_34780 [Blyttiomyces helicus]|uniref:Uncharacterized protein n=1 Tax=Blyttiomyces helicus TaxID=388810 RepID=A0A4P9WES3_9FUNG|nr:hypothetical protein BDK51DRAFT_34780 [Blyttiomyces helicus]|eukprot:RKO91231.1 hypothetical protein BDK51DRAFT_34780 [Blyttiomyces helicus]
MVIGKGSELGLLIQRVLQDAEPDPSAPHSSDTFSGNFRQTGHVSRNCALGNVLIDRGDAINAESNQVGENITGDPLKNVHPTSEGGAFMVILMDLLLLNLTATHLNDIGDGDREGKRARADPTGYLRRLRQSKQTKDLPVGRKRRDHASSKAEPGPSVPNSSDIISVNP